MKLRPILFAPLLIASAGIASAQSADLRVSNISDKSKPLIGATVTFTVTVYNDGADDATGVTASDTMPDGYQFVSANPETGTYDSVTGVWTIGNLGAGQSRAMDVSVKVLPAGNYTYGVSATGNEADPVPANNSKNATPVPTWNVYWDGGTADLDPNVAAPDGASTGGAGTWNTALKNWDPGTGEPDYTAWDNTKGFTASLGGTTPGTVTLASDISAGKLAITGAYTLALGSNSLTLTGVGTAISGNAAITVSGTGSVILGSSQTWDNTSGTMTVSAPVNTGGSLLTLATRSNNLDVSGKISGAGGLTVTSTYTSGTTPTSSGTPTLSNSNDYTGTTTVSGWIWLNSGGVSAFGSDTSDLVFNTGGVRLTGTGSINRGILITGTSGISMVSGSTTLNGVISGTGNLQISANFGTVAPVVLAAANTFTGNCLSGPDGVVRLSHANALEKANLRWADNNGRSVYDLTTSNLSYNIGGLGNATLGNSNNNLNLGNGGASGRVSFGGNNQSNIYVGILSGAAGFRKMGTGTQTLIGANTFTGNTIVAEGTLKLGKINGQTGVSCTTGTTGTNVKRLTVPSSANMYIGQAVAGTYIPAGARITNINTGTQITIDPGPTTPASATTLNFADVSGTLSASPIIEVQAGATLNVVDAPLTVGSAQTLGGAGLVVGPVTTDGTIAPGLAITGTLTTGNLTFSATGGYACTLDGAACDLLAVGTLTVDPAAKITVSGTPSQAEYVIATYTGSEPAHFDASALPSGYSLDYATPGQVKLKINTSQSPYQTWAVGAPYNLTGNDALPGSDPDGDGVKNIAEFALGGNPTSGSANGPSLVKVQSVSGSPALTLTIATRAGTVFDTGAGPRAAAKDGVTYRVEAGTDLSGWTATVTEVAPAITAGLPVAPDGYEYHTFRTAGPVATTPKDFIRVKVDGL